MGQSGGDDLEFIMHVTVLRQEVVDFLHIQKEGFYLDATAGEGGHAEEILKRLGSLGRLMLSDCDPAAYTNLQKKFGNDSRCQVVRKRFSELFDITTKNQGCFQGIVADLGFSSVQLNDPQRGLSFQADGPLDMRLDSRRSATAADLLDEMDEKDLADLFWRFGEERGSRRIAREIVRRRNEAPLETTAELAGLAVQVLGPLYRRQKIHPATRIFQALRIAVNHELEELHALLKLLPVLLAPGGRAVLISFHSLEDRIVKNEFKRLKGEGWQIITKKPVVPADEEIKGNPRSRSAKLRVIEKGGR